MKIITISREFGSGGREIGKQLADQLGFDYYDKEIITAIADKHDMDKNYVSEILDNKRWQTIPLTFCCSFTMVNIMQSIKVDLLVEQTQVIKEIAKAGKNCVIVGRNADELLKDYHPFNIFICADMKSKIRRCIERATKNENLSRKEMEEKIRSIDKNRAEVHEIITHKSWGLHTSYHLIVNASNWNLKELTSAIAVFTESWFRRLKQ
ncbi:AAA family ATPase [Fusobacterium ulcerans]|uniref:cytidylate kinase-like family protein n=1 Tax=Fusobacterium ulcerans TaxID=861 RepID=UPI0026F2D0F8|nr:cytidylate kinase-like family protein [Fusobacterium ulcerans]